MAGLILFRPRWAGHSNKINKNMNILCFLAIFGLSVGLSHAQSDSIRTEYQTEDSKFSADELKRFFRYITRANVEEKTLIKVGFWPGGDRGSSGDVYRLRAGLNAETAVEHKVSPSFSVIGGLDGYWRYSLNRTPTGSLPTGINPDLVRTVVRLNSLEVHYKAGIRYYYAMARRIRQGKSANNFSGNYFSGMWSSPVRQYQTAYLYNWRDGSLFRSTESYQLANRVDTGRMTLLYGVQRRLGRLGYVDVSAGPEVFFRTNATPQVALQINALIGFGW
jgi:hypothetical protein